MRLSYRAAGLALIILVLSACGTVTGGAKIDELETKNAQLQATIDIVGTPVLTIMALEQYATQNVVLQARLSQAENESLAARATLTVLELSSGMAVAQPTPAAPNVAVGPGNSQPQDQQTPFAAEAAPVPTNTGSASLTQFSQTVTATDRDQQDCPLGITSTFSPDTSTIYVNTQINFLPAGSTLSARWTVNGQLYFDDVECWIPSQDYFDICAWCSIVPESGVFDTGEWSVELMLDGQVMAQTSFQVVDSTQQGTTGTQNNSSNNPKGN
jgi:hypothetical protein